MDPDSAAILAIMQALQKIDHSYDPTTVAKLLNANETRIWDILKHEDLREHVEVTNQYENKKVSQVHLK